MKYRLLYFSLSLLVIIPGTYTLIRFGLKPSIDFTGGSTLQLKTEPVDAKKLATLVNKQTTLFSYQTNADNSVTLTLPPQSQSQIDSLVSKMKPEFTKVDQVAFYSVGPTVGQDLLRKTLYAILLATTMILLFVARAFKSFRFGLCAVLAMFHDALVIIGSFALLGHFFNVQVDILFVTALLTVLSFSVHDTIVVYDRIRELHRKNIHSDLETVCNLSVTQTLIRSLNNSLTIIFMLLALVLLGGQSIRWFAVALLIGTITGTYSSTFTATPLLVVFDKLLKKHA